MERSSFALYCNPKYLVDLRYLCYYEFVTQPQYGGAYDREVQNIHPGRDEIPTI